jgi:hypothetical protein
VESVCIPSLEFIFLSQVPELEDATQFSTLFTFHLIVVSVLYGILSSSTDKYNSGAGGATFIFTSLVKEYPSILIQVKLNLTSEVKLFIVSDAVVGSPTILFGLFVQLVPSPSEAVHDCAPLVVQ